MPGPMIKIFVGTHRDEGLGISNPKSRNDRLIVRYRDDFGSECPGIGKGGHSDAATSRVSESGWPASRRNKP